MQKGLQIRAISIIYSPRPNYNSKSILRVFGPSLNMHLKPYYIQTRKNTTKIECIGVAIINLSQNTTKSYKMNTLKQARSLA